METISFNLKEKDALIVVKVNPKIYPLCTIYSASYVFLDRCYIILDGDPEKEILVELRLKKNSNLELGVLAREFFNELLNYAFYEEQSKKNTPLRNTLLRAALLSNVGVEESVNKGGESNEDLNDVDWSEIEDLEDGEIEDPEGIAIPWEEKYGQLGDDNKSLEEKENNPDISKEIFNKEQEFDQEKEKYLEKKMGISKDLSDDKLGDKAVSLDDLRQNGFIDKQKKCSEKQLGEKD